MYVLENPVLQRELLVNLRTNRAFLLLAVYQLLLAAVVLVAWPTDERLDLTTNPPSAQKLVNLFFLGQYVIASLMAPSFAAGAITGEKERHTYEMLLASPLRPGAIVLGKMVASLTHLGMLILASLPIIVLCLPLGGVSVYEVLAAYLGLIVSVILFGAIGVFCSSYFSRTSSSLVVSYLVILPLVILAVMFWRALEGDGELRLKVGRACRPGVCVVGGDPDVRGRGRTNAVSTGRRQRRQGSHRFGKRGRRGRWVGHPTRPVPRPTVCSAQETGVDARRSRTRFTTRKSTARFSAKER